jgi:hypothetical protein
MTRPEYEFCEDLSSAPEGIILLMLRKRYIHEKGGRYILTDRGRAHAQRWSSREARNAEEED